jgi:ribose/xylose/arabinose/galactoside ABC-type transport system permease subunit
MKICVKLSKVFGMLFGLLAGILVLFGVIGFLRWIFCEAAFLNVANYWNFLYASVPFSLLAICCMLYVMAGSDKS